MERRIYVGSGLAAILTVIFWAAGTACAQWPRMAASGDGTLISYEIRGDAVAGRPVLVFVHGWSCDARYWDRQLPYFSKRYRVVALDLAGHGHSGMGRSRFTMGSFGEDVRAVVESAGCRQVILIGHSMGGAVIAEAARLLPERVVGLIGVDTLENIEYPMTRQQLDHMMGPLKADFQTGVRQFVQEMIRPYTDPRLKEWILADMASAPPRVALGAMEAYLSLYISGEAARIFERIRIPVISVNGDMWPINHAGNRRHMMSYEAIVLEGADHFLMMNRPDAFNRALDRAVEKIKSGK